jgi:hypothetical protein
MSTKVSSKGVSTGSTTGGPLDGLVQTGKDIRFYGKVLAGIPSAIKNYPREILRILSEVSFGTGALAVIGGTIGVMTGMSIFVGTVVGMPTSTPARSPRWWQRWRCRRPSGQGSPLSSARCGSTRRSTRSR